MTEERIKELALENFIRTVVAKAREEGREEGIGEAWIAFGFIFENTEEHKKAWSDYINNGMARKEAEWLKEKGR